ncbi:hypothetical protein C8J56DRAFT_801950, partial [Mycena floridula]
HLMIISWGLEANLLPMSITDFNEILSSGCSGPDDDQGEVQQPRQFRIPARYNLENTSDEMFRHVRICAAFVTDTKAYAISDFSCLVRFHVISRTEMWTRAELVPGTEWWRLVWASFPSGPDWVLETDEAIAVLLTARDQDSHHAFAGTGLHLCNDFLGKLNIHPSMPVYEVFVNEKLWAAFTPALIDFMAQFCSPEFRNVAARANTGNPFAFRANVNNLYISHYVFVFHKAFTWVSKDQYNDMARQGLFCATHTIGEPYQCKIRELCRNSKRKVPVYFYEDPINAYTIIAARPPKHWIHTTHANDLRIAGYSTMIGPANFHAQKYNMLNPESLEQVQGKPGRKKKASLPPFLCYR